MVTLLLGNLLPHDTEVFDTLYPFVACRVDHSYDTKIGAAMQEYAKKLELDWAINWINNYESFLPGIFLK